MTTTGGRTIARRVPRGLQAMTLTVVGLVLGACADGSQNAGAGQTADTSQTADVGQTADARQTADAAQNAGRAPAGVACWVRGDPAGLATRASPFDSTEITLDAGTIKVCYSRPRRLERTIMGGLVPFGEPWRLGANEATAIYISVPASIADIDIEPGWYTLYAVPGEEEWQIAVNAATERWGIPIDDAVRARDVGSAVVPVEPTDAPVEMLTMTLQPASSNEATLITEWEGTRVTVPLRIR